MKYSEKRFSVGGHSATYAANFEAAFGKKRKPSKKKKKKAQRPVYDGPYYAL